MKNHSTIRLCAWLVGLILLFSLPAYAHTPAEMANLASKLSITSPTRQPLSLELVLSVLAQSDVVYLGENHDSAADHQAQLEILHSLHRQRPKLAIAMEMFQRPDQAVLDSFLAGKITETQLLEQSQFKQRWGYAWEYYAPILRFAKVNQLPVIALNVPTEITRKVVRNGLKSLTFAERRFIPPLSAIHSEPEAYRQIMGQIFDDIHQGQGNSDRFESFFLAQLLWDETMAERVSQFLQTQPDFQVVVLAGQGHIIYGYGIPSRVTRRMEGNRSRPKALTQSLILLNPNHGLTNLLTTLKQETPIANYFGYSKVDQASP